MNARFFTAAVVGAATLALGVRFVAPAAAQGTSPESIAPSPPAAEATAVALSSGAEDVLKLARAKISDEVTVAFVQTSDRNFNLTASEIVYLRKEGVSENVLGAMLNQSRTTSTPPPASAPATPTASAPQSVAPPTTATIPETVPVSTVYLATTPTYYSFYDPWPYWSAWDVYPFFSLGFSWGWGWGWGWSIWGNHGYGDWNHCNWNNGYWNHYGHTGYYPAGNGHHPPNVGHRPLQPNGNPTPRGNSGNGGRSERAVTERRPAANVERASSGGGFDRIESRTASSTAAARPTSVWSNNGNQPAPARAGGSQAGVATSRGSQAVAPTSLSGSGANNRPSATRRVESPSATQLAGSGRSSSPTTVWSGSASQRPTALRLADQNTVSAASAGRTSASSIATYNRPTSPAANRYMSSAAPSYQSGGFSPSPSYRAGTSAGSVSRPSMSPSFGGMGNSSAFRSGGNYSGAGASRMAPGGGFRSGGGSGGGGGRHH